MDALEWMEVVHITLPLGGAASDVICWLVTRGDRNINPCENRVQKSTGLDSDTVVTKVSTASPRAWNECKGSHEISTQKVKNLHENGPPATSITTEKTVRWPKWRKGNGGCPTQSTCGKEHELKKIKEENHKKRQIFHPHLSSTYSSDCVLKVRLQFFCHSEVRMSSFGCAIMWCCTRFTRMHCSWEK